LLILSRKPGQSIIIGGIVEITVAEIRGDQVRIGVTAPRDVPVFRREVLEGHKGQPPPMPDTKAMLDLLTKSPEAKPASQTDAPPRADSHDGPSEASPEAPREQGA